MRARAAIAFKATSGLANEPRLLLLASGGTQSGGEEEGVYREDSLKVAKCSGRALRSSKPTRESIDAG